MKAVKVIAVVWFVALLIGVPAAVLAGGNPQVARSSQMSEVGTSIDGSIGSGFYGDCVSNRYSSGNCGSYYYPAEPVQPMGVERFLLLGDTDESSPGNSTTSFLMAFFGLAAIVAGLTGLVQKFQWLVTTALLSVGGALFVSAQLLWNSTGNGTWLAAFAFLAVNAAVLAALGFTLFATQQARHLLKVTIVASLLVASVAVQSGIFYDLIGSPDYYPYAAGVTHSAVID